jgi:hypothetical protein
MNLDLGSTLSRAWKITWNNKILWFFGFLASLAGGGASYSTSAGQRNFPSGPSGLPSGTPNLPPQMGRWLEQLRQAGPMLIAIVLVVICLALIIGLVIFLLALVGRGGLIGGARLAQANGNVTFGEAWGAGTRYLGRLFLINLPALILGLIIAGAALGALAYVVFSLAGAEPGTFGGNMLGMVACLVPLFCIIAIVGVLLSILIHFAQLAAIVEDLTPRAAFSRAWTVIMGNIVGILLLGVILIVIGFVVGLILALPAAVIAGSLVLAVAGGAVMRQGAPIAASLAFALLCCAVYVPVAIVLRSILGTWTMSAWTLAYQQFIGAGAAPVVTYPVVPADQAT